MWLSEPFLEAVLSPTGLGHPPWAVPVWRPSSTSCHQERLSVAFAFFHLSGSILESWWFRAHAQGTATNSGRGPSGLLCFHFVADLFYWRPDAPVLTTWSQSGYSCSFHNSFLVFRFSSCLLSWRLMARIFLSYRFRGFYFLSLQTFLRSPFRVWLMTVSTQAMDLQTTQILESLEAWGSWDSPTFESPAVPEAPSCCGGLKCSLGHGCIACLCCLLRGKAFSVPLERGLPREGPPLLLPAE